MVYQYDTNKTIYNLDDDSVIVVDDRMILMKKEDFEKIQAKLEWLETSVYKLTADLEDLRRSR